MREGFGLYAEHPLRVFISTGNSQPFQKVVGNVETLNHYLFQDRVLRKQTPSTIDDIFSFIQFYAVRMGEKSHLLYEYVDELFRAGNTTFLYDATNSGFSAGRYLHFLCEEIVENTMSPASSDLYYKAQNFETVYNSFQNRKTRISLCYVMLNSTYYPVALKDFQSEQHLKMNELADLEKLTDLYQQIRGVIGEEPISYLTSNLKGHLLFIPLCKGFRQGYQNSFMLTLGQVDPETEKTIAQLWLESL